MSPRSLSDVYSVHTTTEQMEQVRAWAGKGAPAGCMAKKGLRKGVHAALPRPLGERTKRRTRAKRAGKPVAVKGRARVSVCELQGAALKALKKDKVRGKAAPVQPAKEVAVEKRLVEAEAELADGVVDEVVAPEGDSDVRCSARLRDASEHRGKRKASTSDGDGGGDDRGNGGGDGGYADAGGGDGGGEHRRKKKAATERARLVESLVEAERANRPGPGLPVPHERVRVPDTNALTLYTAQA